MPLLPASTVRTLRPQVVKSPSERASAALGPTAPGPVPVPAPAPAPLPNKTHDLDVIGPRKLIRPTLPDSARRNRRFQRQDEPTLMVGSAVAHAAPASESSHAESFYLQKQVQAQTAMVFILDDGEKIEGSIEWYDRKAIKVRCTSSPFRNNRSSDAATRALIYKSSIKYLYKAGENSSER
jgi:hypothetical protein